jgi:hypothetical protein
MNESLDEVRRRIAHNYIGKAGIHGIGISRSRNAIRIYVQPDAGTEQKAVLAEIKQAAAPFQVLIVEDEPPKITVNT